jgi:hypothetical protein
MSPKGIPSRCTHGFNCAESDLWADDHGRGDPAGKYLFEVPIEDGYSLKGYLTYDLMNHSWTWDVSIIGIGYPFERKGWHVHVRWCRIEAKAAAFELLWKWRETSAEERQSLRERFVEWMKGT